VRIEFDSAFLYRSRFNDLVPNNSFTVTLDLVCSNILDMNTPPTSNLSVANIWGLKATWANAVYDELVALFRQRRTKRGWLHSPGSYDVLVILIGFPLSFDLVYHLDRLIKHFVLLPEALSVALYVYAVLLVLFLFRTALNYAKMGVPQVGGRCSASACWRGAQNCHLDLGVDGIGRSRKGRAQVNRNRIKLPWLTYLVTSHARGTR
jgi:hypothetical protein